MTKSIAYLAAARRVRLSSIVAANRRHDAATSAREQSRWRKEAARNARKAAELADEIIRLCDTGAL